MDDRDSPSESVNHDEPPPAAEAEIRNWADLPLDLLSSIFQKIGSIEIMMGAQYVCWWWRQVAWRPEMWRRVDMTGHAHLRYDIDMVEMAKRAIDRSAGGLEEFYTENIGDDGLMEYIAKRTEKLKSLRLISCYNITGQGLVNIVNASAHLEELEISLCEFPEEAFAAIGKACPQLKHLRLNRRWHSSYDDMIFKSDVEALAIAENMRGLRRLQLVGNRLTGAGLTEILEGCPQLECLDIRCCFHLKNSIISGNNNIRELKLPDDPTDDYEYRDHIYWGNDPVPDFNRIFFYDEQWA